MSNGDVRFPTTGCVSPAPSVRARGDVAVRWLIGSSEPAIRYLTWRDLLGQDVEPDAAIYCGPLVRGLLEGQQADGSFGSHPYKKWQGAHWRLVALVELAIPLGEPRALAAAETVLDWLCGPGHRRGVKTINGLTRRCASQEGNALAVCCRLGIAPDPRVTMLAESLIEWQWPDGGWNCDPRASGRRSSFHESLAPMWGLWEYWEATGSNAAKAAAERTAELLLEHKLFRRLDTGEVINPDWLVPHYPPYWHYDVAQGLLILSRMGRARDPRAAEALDVLASLQEKDGCWHSRRGWWRSPGNSGSNVEAVDWGRRGPSQMLTLNALRVLRAADRVNLTGSHLTV